MSSLVDEVPTVPRSRPFPVMATLAARSAAEALVRAGWLASSPCLEEQVAAAIRAGRRRFVLPGVEPQTGQSYVPLSDDRRTIATVRAAPSRLTHDVVWLVTAVERVPLPLARPPRRFAPRPWEPSP